jgi:hypothetical protein
MGHDQILIQQAVDQQRLADGHDVWAAAAAELRRRRWERRLAVLHAFVARLRPAVRVRPPVAPARRARAAG